MKENICKIRNKFQQFLRKYSVYRKGMKEWTQQRVNYFIEYFLNLFIIFWYFYKLIHLKDIFYLHVEFNKKKISVKLIWPGLWLPKSGQVLYQSDLGVLRLQPTRCDVSQFIYFYKTLCVFQTVFPSIIRSSKLHLQRQAFVGPLLLPAVSSRYH